jgi:hypothetical protein
MNLNLSTALITASITLFGGVILFVLQQIIDKFFLRPIQKQKEIIERIAIALIHYANIYTNPINYGAEPWDSPHRKRYNEASNYTRELASILKVRSDNIPLYDFWVKIKGVLPRKNLIEAHYKLIGLSNGYGDINSGGIRNTDEANKIRELLKIPIV